MKYFAEGGNDGEFQNARRSAKVIGMISEGDGI
jgi:hypothetical protein